MGRLIDADAINGTFAPSETYTGREVMALLNQQPTAFDVDKVVEQLEDYGKYKGILMDNGETLDNYLPVLKCKQLVKGGGQAIDWGNEDE